MGEVFRQYHPPNIEDRLPYLVFTQENTPLSQVDRDFSELNGKRFIEWLEQVAKDNGKVLELGGGPNQVAALEILRKYPQLEFTEIEGRPLTPKALNELRSFPNSHTIRGKMSDIGKVLREQKFNLIFAHNVFEHQENPFSIIESAYGLLNQEGVMFGNRIIVFREVWEEIEQRLKEKGVVFCSTQSNPPRDMLKAGITYINLAIQKNTLPLRFPVQQGNTFLTDYSGQSLNTFEFYVVPPAVTVNLN